MFNISPRIDMSSSEEIKIVGERRKESDGRSILHLVVLYIIVQVSCCVFARRG